MEADNDRFACKLEEASWRRRPVTVGFIAGNERRAVTGLVLNVDVSSQEACWVAKNSNCPCEQLIRIQLNTIIAVKNRRKRIS